MEKSKKGPQIRIWTQTCSWKTKK